MKKQKHSLINSFLFAFNGLQFAFEERNFKFQIASAVLCVFLGFFLTINLLHWCIIILCIAGVLALEIVNTAIENLVDKVSPEHNPLAGKVKDLAAAAVFLFSIATVIIAVLIFIPYLLDYF